MKYNVKLLVLSLFLVASYATYAQDTIFKGDRAPDNHVVLYSDTSLVRDIGWVRAPFADNWFAQAALGGMMYHGFGDNAGAFLNRITGQWQAHLGRWVFPMVGYRIGGGMGFARGFLSKDDYLQYGGAGGTAFGWGQCGDADLGDGVVRGLGGYYHLYDESTLIQKWKFAYANVDALVNLSYRKSYNPYRPFMTMLYAGAGIYLGLSEGYDGASGHVSADVDPNRSLEVHVGVIEQYQLSERWRIYADLRVSAMQRTFDREWIKTAERPLDVADIMTTLHIGVQYNFNWRSETKRREWYKETFKSEPGSDNTPHYALASQSVRYTNYIDTLFVYDTIVAIVERFNQNKDSVSLGDILDKHLLPYEMVFFELDKWDILSSEQMKIAKMAELMKQFPEYKFTLIGSADSKTGTVKRNDFLSHQRADVVYNKLIIDYGINPKQLERVYLGGILDYQPYQLNRATVIIMKHDKVLKEFYKLKSRGQAGGSQVSW